MNLMKFKFLIFIIFIVGCNKDTNPVKSDLNTDIENSIIGCWIKYDTLDFNNFKPEVYINGIQILNDGTIIRLAVETKTGKVKTYNPPLNAPVKIVTAQDNHITFETSYYIYPDSMSYHAGYTYVGQYLVNNNSLSIMSDSVTLPVSGVFQKTELNNIVCDTLSTELFFIVNQDTFKNADVWQYPSAYLSKFTPDSITNVRITAYNSDYHTIEFNFRSHGIGVYTLGRNKDGFAIYRNFQGSGIQTNGDNDGTIEITDFDVINNRCKGIFNFSIGNIQFSQGGFDIPIYNNQL